MSLRPDLTVAAIIQRDGKFLLVEERVGPRMVFNQPAGHVERGEQLLTAVVRETLEETAWHFQPEALVGVYFWEQADKQRTFMRFAFSGYVTNHDSTRRLDRGIERAVWMSHDDIIARTSRMRSPMVLRCVEDFLSGQRFPMDLVRDFIRESSAMSSEPVRVVDTLRAIDTRR
jgi:8-oxo-dGTP pyrophosphatase MutT (NUDIX family)